MKNQPSQLVKSVAQFVLWSFLVVTLLAVFVPFQPIFPTAGLDNSWMFALNQAVAQKLVFGTDIVLTYGPYASMYTRLYHPATDHLMVWGNVFLCAGYALLLIWFTRGMNLFRLLVFVLFVAGYQYSRDAPYLFYPLLLALFTYRITLGESHRHKLNLSTASRWGLLLPLAGLGLLPLTKGSLLPLSALTAVLCGAVLWIRGERLLACLFVTIPAASLALFWAISGQPILALPAFLIRMNTVVSGYTDAMSASGKAAEWILYLLAAAMVLRAIASNRLAPKESTAFLCASVALFLFVCFKGGFVRHDGHALIAGTSIVMCSLLTTALMEKRAAMTVAFALSLISGIYTDTRYVKSSVSSLTGNLLGTYSSMWEGIRMRLFEPSTLPASFDAGLAAIRKEFPIPELPGTTDTYSYHQSELLASGNRWSPRPTIQSYAAYAPSLLQLNEAHLQGDRSPDHIMFAVEPIDGRLPALEDGLSWPSLIENYSIERVDNMKRFSGEIAYLKKLKARGRDTTATEISSATHNLGEEVILPETPGNLFAEIGVRPTWAGRALSTLFKLPHLNISVTFDDGRERNFRFVASMGGSRFLLSPLVENTSDFIFLASGQDGYFAGKHVRNIRLYVNRGSWGLWNSSYLLKLSTMDLHHDAEMTAAIPSDRMLEGAPRSISGSSSVMCEGSIDMVNGISPAPASATVGGILAVEGWTAVAPSAGIAADEPFVTLSDAEGQTFYVKARSTPRLDVKEHFLHPEMPDVGFVAFVDVSKLSGKYALGLARSYKGQLERCQQFSIPLRINQ